MKWRRHAEPPVAADDAEEPTVSDETRRALEAADAAEAELAHLRRAAPKIAASGERLERENQHNGFYLLIRQALGSG